MCTFGDRKLAYSGAKVQSRIYPGDLVIRTGDSFCMWETDYPGELACMCETFLLHRILNA